MKIKLSSKTHKSLTIDGKRYNYARIIKDLCTEENKAGNYWLGNSIEIIKRCQCVVIQDISGSFVIIEA